MIAKVKQPKIDDSAVFTAADLARALGCAVRIIVRLASEGRIPFARKIGSRWLFTADSRRFLLEHYSPRGRTHYRGSAGKLHRDAMLEAARQLDPDCAPRQEQCLPQWWQPRAGQG